MPNRFAVSNLSKYSVADMLVIFEACRKKIGYSPFIYARLPPKIKNLATYKEIARF